MELETLIEDNARLIYKVVGMFKYSGVDNDDLKQVGKLGFIEAYNNFDPSKGVKFTTYAYPYIYGSISKYVKDNKGVKISRDITKLYYKIEKAYLLYMQKFDREPKTEELAEFLEIDESLVIEALLSKNCLISMDEAVVNSNKDLTLHEVIADKEEDIDSIILLKECLSLLEPEEYELIKSRYFDELSQSEIANTLGTSQVQISRREDKVKQKLKTMMTS